MTFFFFFLSGAPLFALPGLLLGWLLGPSALASSFVGRREFNTTALFSHVPLVPTSVTNEVGAHRLEVTGLFTHNKALEWLLVGAH